MNNDNWKRSMTKLIEALYLVQRDQTEIDCWYDKFVTEIFTELDKHMSFYDAGRNEIKQFKYHKH